MDRLNRKWEIISQNVNNKSNSVFISNEHWQPYYRPVQSIISQTIFYKALIITEFESSNSSNEEFSVTPLRI